MESIICIPRMDLTIQRKYILNTLYKLNWGHISIINEIPLRNEPDQKRILIRIKWDECAEDIRSRVNNGDSIKLVHDINSPWFWKIVLGKS